MDDETSSRIRDAILDAVRRQRPQPDTEAAKQQMLVTTLRLAGHTVNLIPHEPAALVDADPTDEHDPADGTDGPTETAPAETIDSDNPRVHDGVNRFDDPSRPANQGKIRLLPAIVNDPTQSPDYGKPRFLPYVITHPTPADSGGLPRPQPIRRPQPYVVPFGAVPDESEQDSVPDEETGSSFSGLEITPADSDGFSSPAADSTGANSPVVSDGPPSLSIAIDDESADSAPSPAPGTKLFLPSPGAGSSSFPPSLGGNGGDGDSQPSDSGDPSGAGQTPGGPPAIMVQPTASLTERSATAAADKALSLAQTTVETAVSDLRQEIYVSRAARNALFPR